MSLAGRKRRRQTEIRQKRKRNVKLCKLNARLQAASSDSERAALTAKILKINPGYQFSK
ncbi:MAG TPA: hypothetical protein PLO78_05465 [Candidatus Omnitrophota bacterium]|nr:hypothetical protein [Candidatus Omnitrophota bacterium]